MRCVNCRSPLDAGQAACPACGAAPDRLTSVSSGGGAVGRVWRWLVGIVIVTVACGGGTWLMIREPLTPEQVVYRYFEALADRDADEARSYLLRGPEEDVETLLLDDNTVEHRDYTPPDHLRITGMVPHSSRLAATMQVTYRVAGRTYDREYRFLREYTWESWRMMRGWSTLPLNIATPDPLVVAGLRIPQDELRSLPAFPGAYVVRLARNPTFEASPMTVVADAKKAPRLPLRLKGERQSELERQIRVHLDDCAARPDPEPTGCPFERSSDVAYPSTVRRRIVAYPSVGLLVNGADTLVASGTLGRAEVRDGVTAASSPPIGEEQIRVTGRVEIDGDGLTFVPG